MSKYACIKAISTYLPEQVEQNTMGDERFVRKLGIEERHIAGAEESAGDMAAAAAETLFRQYGLPKENIDYILLCTQHPDYPMPATACILQSRLGLSQNCGALDFNMGCSGYLYGLSLAKGLVEAGMAENVLFLTSSVYTKYINKKDATIRPLFGDGATATWIAAEEGERPFLHSFVFGTDGERFDKIYIPVGGSRNMPREHPEVFETDERGNVRSNYEVYMDGNAISYFTLRTVPAMVEKVLEKAGRKREEIDYYVFHQANRFMMSHVQKKCHLEGMAFYNDIRDIGNTVSGTVPFGLEYVLREKSPQELGAVLLAGFGVGLSWAGCVADLRRMQPKAE